MTAKLFYHYSAAVTQCYGLICASVTKFLRGLIWIFAGCYGSVTHPSDVTVNTNIEIVGQHRLYRVILIVIKFFIYKLQIFLPPSEFELWSIN